MSGINLRSGGNSISKILGIVLGIVGLLSVYYIPMIELQVEANLLILDINVNDQFSMYDLLQTLENYNFDTQLLKITMASVTVGSILISLSFLNIHSMLVGSLVTGTGVSLFIYNYILNTDSTFSDVDLVNIDPKIGAVLLLVVPIISLVLYILNVKYLGR